MYVIFELFSNLSKIADAQPVLLSTGKVLVAGGLNGNALQSAEIYDPVIDQWAATPNLHSQRGKN